MSVKTELDDIKVLIAAATGRPSFTHEEARQEKPKTDHTIVYVSRRFGGNVRGGSRENDLRLLQVRAVAKSESNAYLLEHNIAALFAYDTHTVAGQPTHFAFETQDPTPERDDDGWFTRLTDYTYGL